MADQHDADKPKSLGPSAAAPAPAGDANATDEIAGAPTEFGSVDKGHKAGAGGHAPKAGANDDGPAAASQGAAAGDGNLYDRLAAKDQEPAGSGGDGPVP